MIALVNRLPHFAVVNDDPIFAAITAHRAAIRKQCLAFNKAEAAEIAARDTKEASLAKRYHQAEKEHVLAEGAEKKAERQLLRTKPTTAAGVAALLKYALRDVDDVMPGGWAYEALKSVTALLDAAAKAA
jgi:hypothetical protein